MIRILLWLWRPSQKLQSCFCALQQRADSQSVCDGHQCPCTFPSQWMKGSGDKGTFLAFPWLSWQRVRLQFMSLAALHSGCQRDIFHSNCQETQSLEQVPSLLLAETSEFGCWALTSLKHTLTNSWVFSPAVNVGAFWWEQQKCSPDLRAGTCQLWSSHFKAPKP